MAEAFSPVIHLKTKETGLDKISEEEIEKEILASRRKRAGKNRQLKRV